MQSLLKDIIKLTFSSNKKEPSESVMAYEDEEQLDMYIPKIDVY